MTPNDRASILAYLREKLTAVRKARRDERIDTPRTVAVYILAGMDRSAFQQELGDPDLCDFPNHSPCASATRWHYVFHHVPGLGGGTMLSIRFDQEGSSTSVGWVLSK